MNYWWCNQNQTHRQELAGGFLWSPKTKAKGHRNQFYDNMQLVRPGDVIFSFVDTRIKALGLALSRAQAAPKPDFGAAGGNWAADGWFVVADFERLNPAIRPKDHIAALRSTLPAKYSPLRATGDGLQSVYLAAVPETMAAVLQSVIGPGYAHALHVLESRQVRADPDDLAEQSLAGRTDLPETERQQLVRARRGQGVFRANVERVERGCRLTGVTDRRHLRASHIKPWRHSTDVEKLHGCNGLLLSPHVDALFDRGWISFSDRGELLLSERLDRAVLAAWQLPDGGNCGAFNPEQQAFLAYHRAHVFMQRA